MKAFQSAIAPMFAESSQGASAVETDAPMDDLEVSEQTDISIAEEFILLLLNDETGFVAPIPEWRIACSLVGSVLLDLSFKNRIDTDDQKLTVLDPTPTGDEMLDETFATLSAAEEEQSPRYWIEQLAPCADALEEAIFLRLVKRGFLEHDSAGFWSLSRQVQRRRESSNMDAAPGAAVRARIMRVLFQDELPDPHDVALIALVDACGGFKATLTQEDYEQVEERIELFAGMDLFGRAVLQVVRSSYTPPARMVRRAQTLPVIGLWSAALSKSLRAGNLPKFFAEQAERLGPAYVLSVPGREFVILAGAEINHWIGRKGRLHLRACDYLHDFQEAWGTSRSIASMDGAEHYRMRRAATAGNARSVVEDQLSDLFGIGRVHLIQWQMGDALPGEMTCQRLTGKQIASLSTSIDPPIETLDGLLAFEFRALLVYVMGLLPKWTLRTPAMRRAHKAVLALYDEIHASHSPAQRENKRRDLVDDLMALHQSDPQFLPETDLEFSFIAPLIAGHYVGSAMSFALYELMAHPDLFERIAAEADALFANGDPASGDLTLAAMDVTHRFVMETMRLHAVIPVHNRVAANSFEVEGRLVPARSTVLVAYPATHHMAEHFPNPDAFDIDRFAPPRNEHRKRGAFRPFGVGTHACLGSKFTELTMAANLLLIAHHFELELVPADYKLKLSPLPKICPDKKFRFRVKRIRNPLPS